jgi:hypothetical protein
MPNNIKPIWVKKKVSGKQWNDYYSHLSSYCFLRKELNDVVVGFCVANSIPPQCEELTDDELWQVDNYRRIVRQYPLPLKENDRKTTKISSI